MLNNVGWDWQALSSSEQQQVYRSPCRLAVNGCLQDEASNLNANSSVYYQGNK